MINYNAALPPLPFMGKSSINVNNWMGEIKGNLTYLVRSIFANNEQGFAYDPNDLTAEKIKWRRNLFTETEFRNGLNDVTLKAGTLTPVAFAGLTQGTGIQVDTATGGTYIYKSATYKANTPYTFSCYVRMLDGSTPRFGRFSADNNVDICLVARGATVQAIVEDLGGGLFRAYATVSGSVSSSYFGVVKYADNSSKPVIVSGYQLEEASQPSSYQPFTDFNSEFLRQFPLHTLYQDAAGTIPVTAAGQPVGLMKDKSGRNNHAFQTVSASRPILGRMPEGGVRNILISSADRTHSSWTHQGGTKVLNVLDAKGTYKATRFSGASTSPPYILAAAKPRKAGAHTLRIQVKAGSSAFINATLMFRNNTTAVNYSTGVINLVTGSIVGNGWSSKELPNGFWECTFTQSTGISLDDVFNVYFGLTGITSSDFDIIVGEVQLESGTQATAYQETRGLTDVTESGRKDVYYLAFDGVDDFLQTNSIDFTTTDKVSLFAGVRKLSDAQIGVLAELSPQLNLNNGSFTVFAPGGIAPRIDFLSKGTLIGQATYSNVQVAAPVSAVVTAVGDISGGRSILKINGAKVSTTNADQGTGNYGNHPLYIGRRAGASFPFNGHIYGLIGIGKLTSDDETVDIEKELAKRLGVTLNV